MLVPWLLLCLYFKLAASHEVRVCSAACEADKKDVCACDGKIYINKCHMDFQACMEDTSLVERPNLFCECTRECPSDIEKVCGSDGIIYDNQCKLDIVMCRDATIKKEVIDYCICSMKCPKQFYPVCGSDGNAYNNLCKLEEASCRSPEGITLMDMSYCQTMVKTSELCDENCTNDGDIVCGNDGKLYLNHCYLRMAACKSGATIENVDLEHCILDKHHCPRMCPLTYSPVCTSNGVVYDNECVMEARLCRNRERGVIRKGLQACYNRRKRAEEECGRTCPEEIDRVCGSDGKIYDNLCEMEMIACKTGGRFTPELVPMTECTHRKRDAGTPDGCHQLCPVDYDPVCASNKVVYNNHCEMRGLSCRSKETVREMPMSFCDKRH